MNDLDKAIRAELERMVPVTGEADWDAVARAAKLQPRALVKRRRHALWIALASLIIVGAAVAATAKLPWWQRGSHPQAVIADVYRDGRLSREWNCPSLRAAIRALPADVVKYSNLDAPMVKASTTRCAAALASLAPGSSEDAVRTALGPPDVIGRCWIYGWNPLPTRKLQTDARVCINDGHVTSIIRYGAPG
jgi:hypothetical protein